MMNSITYKRRRKELARRLDGGLIVLTSYELMQQSADMTHPYGQEANFLYLTGITEPNWQMIYDGIRDKCWLVRPDISDVEKLFAGELSAEAAIEQSGADTIIENSEFDGTLRQCARQHAAAHTVKAALEDVNFVVNPAQKRLTKRLDRIFANVSDAGRTFSDMRAIKEPEEIALIKKAIAVTGSAFETVRANITSYRHEYEVEAEFWYEFRKNNMHHAYSPIIASGNNATILHYESNSAKIKRQSLLLMDCGAAHKGYAADISRTIATGEPTKEQQRIYDGVLDAHHRIIELIKPGLSFGEYQRDVDMIMKSTLQSLGLLEDIDDTVTYRRYFPHAISHGLGLDVHESLGSSGYFKPGMLLTVEPGIYCAQKQLGIRIEDNILVTEASAQNLSRRISTALS